MLIQLTYINSQILIYKTHRYQYQYTRFDNTATNSVPTGYSIIAAKTASNTDINNNNLQHTKKNSLVQCSVHTELDRLVNMLI